MSEFTAAAPRRATKATPSKTAAAVPAQSTPEVADDVENASTTSVLFALEAQKRFAEVTKLLEGALQTDEPHNWTGNSDRLLRIARDVSLRASTEPFDSGNAQHVAFDIAALVQAAKLVPGDTESPERFVLLKAAESALDWITGLSGDDAGCCTPNAARPQLLKKPLSADVAAEIERSPEAQRLAERAFHLAIHGESVLRTAAEADTGDARANAIWGVMTVLGLALQEFEGAGKVFPRAVCESADMYLSQAIGTLSFIGNEPIVEAVAVLLDMASEELSGALAEFKLAGTPQKKGGAA